MGVRRRARPSPARLPDEHNRLSKRTDGWAAAPGDAAGDRRDPANHFTTAVDLLDEEPEIVDDFQLRLTPAGLLALRVSDRVGGNNAASGQR